MYLLQIIPVFLLFGLIFTSDELKHISAKGVKSQSSDTNKWKSENVSDAFSNSDEFPEQSYLYGSSEPEFVLEKSTNVTSSLGTTAILNCRVKNIGNKTVSWVRHRDIHLLSVGKFSYTTDERFRAIHSDTSEDWLLKIHYVQHRDSGWYECQISVTPPRSHRVYLSVVEPETVIVGGQDVFINAGSRLALTCSVKLSPEPPAYIFWYHGDKLVSYDQPHGSFHVQTEKGEVSTSRLLVKYATTDHSGIYTCTPANSKPKTVNVHVLAGEKPAAIQHENNSVSLLGPMSMSTVASLSFLSLSHVIFF